MKKLFSLLFLTAALFSCKKEDQDKIDQDIITKYIADQNLDAKATGSGLYYVIEEEGTGRHPESNSYVKVAYKGYLTDGTVFDQSSAAGIKFKLTQVIEGWTEGIPLFKVGEKGKLIIPSKLGYGDQSTSGIPANSVLVFDIELLYVY